MADQASRPLSAVTGGSQRASQQREESHRQTSYRGVSSSPVVSTPKQGRKRQSTANLSHIVQQKKTRSTFTEEPLVTRLFHTRSQELPLTPAESEASDDSSPIACRIKSLNRSARNRSALSISVSPNITYLTRSQNRERLLAFQTTFGQETERLVLRASRKSHDKISKSHKRSSTASSRSTSESSSISEDNTPISKRVSKSNLGGAFLQSVIDQSTPRTTRRSSKQLAAVRNAQKNNSPSTWTVTQENTINQGLKKVSSVLANSRANTFVSERPERRYALRSYEKLNLSNNNTIATIEKETPLADSANTELQSATKRIKTETSKNKTSGSTTSGREKHKALNLGARLGRGSREPLETSQGGGSLLRRSTRGEHITMPAPREKKKKDKGKLVASTTGSCVSSVPGGRGGSRSNKGGSAGSQAGPSTSTINMSTGEGADSKGKDGVPPLLTEASGGVPPNVAPNPDSESDDSEVGRLQALLEARGLPPHLFGALGPRMQHLLHRSMGANSSTKAQQLLQGLQAGDESQQLQAVIEMCQMLVMGNEDTLTGFPVRTVVPALITLLGMEHNFDMMNHACRALTYMMEALPRSSAVVVDAVPVFLEKLQVIQCMDVAEQSLTALDMLSRRHSKAILQARGVTSCLMYLDFFSINAQRAALSITSNCCQNLHAEEYHFIGESLSLLAARLTQQDKKSVESVCLAFSRLVDSYQHDPSRLQEMASVDLLTNSQQLLVVSPPIISTGTFITVLRMLSVMCSNCPDLALTLLRQNIADTLLYLLTGSSVPNNLDDIELTQRSPQELYEITCLIGELMPRLPTDGIFAVDAFLEKPMNNIQDTVQWQWKGNRDLWHLYTSVDSRIIEAAYQNSDDEISLSTSGRTYTVDFHAMQQINEDSGTTRPVQRKINTQLLNDGLTSTTQPQNIENSNQSTVGITTLSLSNRPSNLQRDARVACLREERGLASAFIRSLFSVLYEVYSSSAGPSVRCKCLKALLRMVYYANADLLKDVLKNQVVSSHIAGMMASSDLRIVVGSLQMADILMLKLPDVFGVHFRREGVMHHIKQLADPAIPLSVSPPKSANSSVAGSSAQTNLNLPQENTPSGTKISNLTALKLDQIASKHLVTSSKLNNVSNKSSSSSSKSTSSTVTPIASVSTSNNTSLNNSSPLGVSPVNSFLSGQPSGSSLLNSSISPLSGSIVGGNPDSSNTSTNGSVLMGAMTNAGLVYTSAPDAKRYADLLEDDGSQSPSQMRLSDVLKRKRVPKRATLSSRSKSRTEEMNLSSSVMQDLFNKATSLGTAAAGRSTPTGSSSRSRFSGATSKTTSFLASLNPARWGRQAAPHSAGFGKDASSTSLIKSSSNPNLTAGNREKARSWVRNQASKFIEMYSENENSGPPHPALNVLSCLTAAIQKLPLDYAASLSALIELRDILIESDISPFEVNHSGLIRAMINFMASEDGVVSREDRLRAFLHVFAGCPQRGSYCGPLSTWNPVSFGALVAKLSGCVSQLEQFPVKVHDLPAGTGAGRGGTSALKFFNTHQLKCNLQRHPDCSNLKQWKGGTVKIDPLALVQAIERYLVVRGYGRLRDKDTGESDDDNSEDDIDDTLAAVVISQGGSRHKLQFIMGEQILPYNMTVYQAVRQFSVSGNDQSETDTDTETPLGNAGVWVQTHTIYYRPVPEDAGSSKSLNVQHTTRKGKTSSKTHIRRKGDDLWNEGIVPAHQSPLTPFLSCNLPECVNIQDASLEVLCLLRILHALNRYWGGLYPSVQYMQIIPHTDFINTKIAAKANRQLQDPLVIMTGNLPQWLNQVAAVCPFLFPFETRQLLFYAISFDRDRALQRLLDSTPELSSNDSTERVTPRLDRRKRTISRDDILKQAEAVIQDFANSKALLEVQYENEVGTGLGPTLEFYTLVSLELQRADLDLWHGSESSKQKSNISDVIKSNTFTDNFVGFDNTTLGSSLINTDFRKTDSSLQMLIDTSGVDLPSDPSENLLSNPESDQSPDSVAYVNNPTGLFPMSMGRTTKVSQMSKVKSKFKFLGKFMAKAVMDSRMLDLPFSNAFYRWVLGQENSLSLADLVHVAPEVHKTLVRLQDIVHRRNVIEADTLLNLAEKKQRLDSLDLDGCPIVDLGLDFILPGHATIELKKGGKDTPVTLENLDQYITLVTHWFLYEGVTRQMDAFREGFDSVFPLSHLRMFYPEELEAVFCGANAQSWDARILSECCRTDHGFNQDSRAIKFLFEILSSYNKEEQRMFLQFITGSPRLPTGGFKSLSPPLTIVRKTLEPNMNPDDYLPSVMTCVNYLKLPDYSSIEAMRTKLRIAASEGQHSFHLS